MRNNYYDVVPKVPRCQRSTVRRNISFGPCEDLTMAQIHRCSDPRRLHCIRLYIYPISYTTQGAAFGPLPIIWVLTILLGNRSRSAAEGRLRPGYVHSERSGRRLCALPASRQSRLRVRERICGRKYLCLFRLSIVD
jgi:hypothetical protein